VVFGGHASEAGWFRSRTVLYHNDVVVMDRQGTVQWKTLAVEGEPPAPREFHTLTALSPTRLLLFGGDWSPFSLCPLPPIAQRCLPPILSLAIAAASRAQLPGLFCQTRDCMGDNAVAL